MNATGDSPPTRALRPSLASRDRSPALLLASAVLLVPSVHAGALPVEVFSDGFEPACAVLLYQESFDADAGNWPAPWIELADSAAVADIASGEARLRPVPAGNPYPLARMAADVPTTDVDVRFRLRMQDASRNGVGFYVRQNGGHMLNTPLHGSGYAVFVEGSFQGQAGIGLWREEDGDEIKFGWSMAGLLDPQSNVDYEVRYQVRQEDANTTTMRARLWASGDPEPTEWHVTASNQQADLQNVSGGIAVDSWDSLSNDPTPAHTWVDNIEIRGLCGSF